MTETYELEIDIDAPRARVWRAMTDPKEVTAWFAEHADISLDEGRYDVWGRFVQGNPSRGAGRGRILDVEVGRRLHLEMPYGGAPTDVEITLDEDTLVRVVHSQVPEAPSGVQRSPRHLWSSALYQLRSWIERGDAGPRFDYTWPTHGRFEIAADVPAPPATVMAALDPARGGWHSAEHRRPARSADEDFAWDVGAEVGIKVLDLVGDERLALAWIQDTATTLTYTLSPSARGTFITLVHSGFGGETDETGMAEGFFSGLVELYWHLATNGTWPPPVTPIASPFPQSGWKFGVRVLQNASVSAH